MSLAVLSQNCVDFNDEPANSPKLTLESILSWLDTTQSIAFSVTSQSSLVGIRHALSIAVRRVEIVSIASAG